MDILIIIGIGIAIVLVGVLLIPFLQKKYGLFKNGLVTQKQLIKLAKVIVEESDLKRKDLYTAILEASKHAVDYAEQMATQKDLSDEKKKELALEAARKILEVAEIEIDENVEVVLDIMIEVTVKNLPRNKDELKGRLEMG